MEVLNISGKRLKGCRTKGIVEWKRKVMRCSGIVIKEKKEDWGKS